MQLVCMRVSTTVHAPRCSPSAQLRPAESTVSNSNGGRQRTTHATTAFNGTRAIEGRGRRGSSPAVCVRQRASERSEPRFMTARPIDRCVCILAAPGRPCVRSAVRIHELSRAVWRAIRGSRSRRPASGVQACTVILTSAALVRWAATPRRHLHAQHSTLRAVICGSPASVMACNCSRGECTVARAPAHSLRCRWCCSAVPQSPLLRPPRRPPP